MGFFRRRRRTSTEDPVTEFWTWWGRQGSATVAKALDLGARDYATGLVKRKIHAIQPDLSWELAPGLDSGSRYMLVVTALGLPQHRALARRWLLAAPPADEVWAYADAHQPLPEEALTSIQLVVHGESVRFTDIVVAAQQVGAGLEVRLFHPSFVTADQETRSTIGLLALERTLGQVDTECWIHAVEFPQFPPEDAFALLDLRGVVAGLKRQFTDEDGGPQYVMFEGEGLDGPLLAMAQVPLAPVTAPHLDTHVAVFLPYSPAEESGLPTARSLGDLRTFEDELMHELGAQGRIVAHQTSAGTRVLHVYVDGTTQAAQRVSGALSDWTEGKASVIVTGDPDWEMVSHLRP